ncbi:MAG: OmpA family protein [Candidatus Eisenbacteria bacterium]|uniref:OmpA family protein n=1 Tax=Eiseniibacteriota bacterium TaxID=2212470 RepID=A0A938BQ35_UNCEI|nr:OmpA family protein [Candidatus Eisenbacteria bacterium]
MAESGFPHEPSDPAMGEDLGRPQGRPAEEGAPAWVVTYCDLMSLLLCFFVLIASFSTMDVIKYRSLVGSMRSALGAAPSIPSVVALGRTASISAGDGMTGRESVTDEMLEHKLTAAVAEEGLTGSSSLQRTDRGIALAVRDQVFFPPGSAELRPEALALLRKVAAVCRHFPRRVFVEGHTDNLPLRAGAFASNWELSTARATAVVRYLLEVEHIAPERFAACGYAGSEPVASHSTPEGRAENRRVAFVFSRAGAD